MAKYRFEQIAINSTEKKSLLKKIASPILVLNILIQEASKLLDSVRR